VILITSRLVKYEYEWNIVILVCYLMLFTIIKVLNVLFKCIKNHYYSKCINLKFTIIYMLDQSKGVGYFEAYKCKYTIIFVRLTSIVGSNKCLLMLLLE
jgi:hypothetical protein